MTGFTMGGAGLYASMPVLDRMRLNSFFCEQVKKAKQDNQEEVDPSGLDETGDKILDPEYFIFQECLLHFLKCGCLKTEEKYTYLDVAFDYAVKEAWGKFISDLSTDKSQMKDQTEIKLTVCMGNVRYYKCGELGLTDEDMEWLGKAIFWDPSDWDEEMIELYRNGKIL